jgi:chemotaxis response regulator CheB
MPKEAIRLGGVGKVLPLTGLGPAIVQWGAGRPL